MDCIKYLHSYEEVAELVASVQERRILNPTFWEKYRGQGRPEYVLTPTIARGVSSAADVRDREALLLDTFQQELTKRGLDHTVRRDAGLTAAQNKWILAMQAQHLGIPTRFLDWSIDWRVGLWFAVENPKNDAVDGQFWVFSVPDQINCNDPHFFKLDFIQLPHTIYVNPAIHWSDELEQQIGEIKRFRQHGQFSISPYDGAFVPLEDQPFIRRCLEKYCIPAVSKAALRARLEAEGIHKQFMYYEEKARTELDKLIEDIRAL